MSTIGLLLAAGAGRRFGGPKALEPGWLPHAVEVLRAGGCDQVWVVIGAEAEAVRPLVPPGVGVVVATDWSDGMGASLRHGLKHLVDTDATAAMLHLVDLPDVGADVVRRVLDAGGAGPDALARASFDTVPGHPVLIGRTHWQGVVDAAAGDAGARGYLRDHAHLTVECGDLATGVDVDQPANP